ncbi:hypothetical protein ACOMHN_012369 [Nucella lapillus]
MACPVCNIKCKKTDKALECDLCSQWYHAKCQDISDEMYDVIKKDSKSAKGATLQWHCTPSCNKVAAKFSNILKTVQEKIEHVSQEMNIVKEKVTKIEDGQFTEEMGTDTTATAAVDTTVVQKMIEQSSRESIAKTQDRARRSKNLLIFGMEEPKGKEKKARQKEDDQKTSTLHQKISTESKPTETRRLGIYNKDKVRPLRQTFATQAERDATVQTFRKTKKAQESAENKDTSLDTLGMRRDMTPTERSEETALLAELKKKQENSRQSGDDKAHWVRRNGQVVNVGKYPEGHVPPREQQN